MDYLTPFFDHFSPSAKVFYTGNLCTTSEFDTAEGRGHLHVLRAGAIELKASNGHSENISEPSLLLHASPMAHRIKPADESGADLICASIDLGSGLQNPLVTALPPILKVKLSDISQLTNTLNLLFAESGVAQSGQRAALDRLTEYLLILLLRYVIDSGHVSGGIIAGLGDPRLQKAIKAMHEQPGHPWTLHELAEYSAMSRARFAARFKAVTGSTPLHHLTQWRIGVACSMLKKGSRIDRISSLVGYNSQSAFTRVFTKHMGMPPSEWLELQSFEQAASTSASQPDQHGY